MHIHTNTYIPYFMRYNIMSNTVKCLAQVSQHRCGVEDTGCDGASNGTGGLGAVVGGEINICGGTYAKQHIASYVVL